MIQLLRLAPLFVACSAVLAAPQEPQTLRIGTWNLEFLGAQGNFRNNLPPRDDADYAAIGAKVRELGVAVLAVQEICGEEPLRKVAAGAGGTWQCFLGTSGGWDDGKTSQQVGFLYDSAVVDLVGAGELLSLPREIDGTPIFHRVPVTAAFRHKATGMDFRAVTVHLKAGQKDLDKIKRRLEAGHLDAWLRTALAKDGEDRDVVVLGDFNSTYATDPQTILEKGGAFQYLVANPQAPTIMHFPEPIDQIVVGKDFAEAKRDGMKVHGDLGDKDKDAWRKTYSDHFPVTIDLVAAGDDDPQATFAFDPAQALPASARPKTDAATAEAPAKPVGDSPAAATEPAKAAPEAPRTDRRWPPSPGTMLRVTYGMAGEINNMRTQSGLLVEPLPMRSQGWVVLKTDANLVVAIPIERVLSIDIQ